MNDVTPGTALKPLPPKLPASIDDWTRYTKTQRTLNDLVEELHRGLVKDEAYRNFLYATYDEQAIEGSLAADNFKAADMIREQARKEGGVFDEVGRQKLATIVKAQGVVLRRYHKTRKERRNMVAGEIVPGNDSE